VRLVASGAIKMCGLLLSEKVEGRTKNDCAGGGGGAGGGRAGLRGRAILKALGAKVLFGGQLVKWSGK